MKEALGIEMGVAATPEIVVLGLGNYLLRDEGVGVHAIRAFEEVCPRGVLSVDVGTAILRAEHLLESARLAIAFDAMKAGGTPGSVYVTDASGLQAGGVQSSLHEYGLVETLNALGRKAPQMLILGVEPAVIEYGCALSASTRAAIPVLLNRALEAIEFWRCSTEDAATPRPDALLEWVSRWPGVQQIRPVPVG